MKKIACLLVVFCGALAAENHIAIENKVWSEWDSPEGISRLHKSRAKENVWKLLRYYESQTRGAYCAVASSVVALNSLSIEAPQSKFLGKYRMFTQEEFFSDEVRALIEATEVEKRGMTMEELTAILETFPVKVSKYEALSLTKEEIHSTLISALKNPHQRVLVNYHRKELQQIGAGHWSPMAAYDADSDSFLILDVSRYKYPPMWVNASEFISSMQTLDDGQSRGFIIIQTV